MENRLIYVTVFLVSLANPDADLMAQPQYRGFDNGRVSRDTKEMPCYGVVSGRGWEVSNHQTIDGRVAGVKYERSCMGDRDVAQLDLLSAGGEALIILGPGWWLEQQNLQFVEGESVKAIGTMYRNGEEKILVASEIEKSGVHYVLRDDEGRPVWRAEDRSPLQRRESEWPLE